MKITYAKYLLVAAVSGVLLSGCSTRTRLGQIIPGHRLSEQEEDEVVKINVIPLGSSGPIKALGATEPGKASFFDPGIAAAAAGLAIDFVKSELEKEAELYDAQFGKKAWMTTDELGSDATYIVLSRWVRPRRDVVGDFRRAPGNIENQAHQVASLLEASQLPLRTKLIQKIRAEGTTLFGKLDGRDLAFLFILELKPHGNSRPFTIRPAYLWSWKTKAKVVAFDWGSGLKPWKWVGAIIFQGDSKVTYKVDVSLESLLNVKAKDSSVAIPAMVNTGPAAPIIPNLTHKLGRTNAYDFEDKVGGWFDVPNYTKDTGFFTVEIKVSESDASNVKKKLTKAADYLGDHKESLIEKITGAK